MPNTALIVDDDEKMRRMLQFLLIAKGFKVELATDGKSGLEAFKSSRPDIVVLDLMMPEMDGLEFYKKAKEDSSLKDTPILVLTADLSDKTGEMLDSLGAKRIAKPFRSSELLAALNTAITGSAESIH